MGDLYLIQSALAPLRRAYSDAETDPETGEVLVSPDLLAALDSVELEYGVRLVEAEKYARCLESDAAPFEARAEAFIREAERIRANAVALRREADAVRRAVFRSMLATKTESVSRDGITLSLRSGSTKVAEVTRSLVPQEFLRPPAVLPPEQWDVDKEAAARAMKATLPPKPKGKQPLQEEGTVVPAGKVIPGLALVRGAPKLVIT